ncbi:MAG: hypothetical protein ACR2RV_24510 [Verrucomicrobiales bacterium]
MRTNAADQRDNSPREQQRSAAIPDIKILRPDGSWKPIGACAATPEQFEGRLSADAIERFIARAQQSNLALERVIAAIRGNWKD